MNANFATTLTAHKTSMAANNALQNDYMKSRKELTIANKRKYKELYIMIMKVMNARKLVFEDSVRKDEFSISKTIGTMRASNGVNS